jgi:hypothetical protein
MEWKNITDITFLRQVVPMVLDRHTTELQCDRILPPHHWYATTLGAELDMSQTYSQQTSRHAGQGRPLSPAPFRRHTTSCTELTMATRTTWIYTFE